MHDDAAVAEEGERARLGGEVEVGVEGLEVGGHAHVAVFAGEVAQLAGLGGGEGAGG